MPWAFQVEAWDAYAQGFSGLIQVPTGSGKTYAAYMGPLAELIDRADPRQGVAVVYITPLRAVVRDIEKALRAPVADMGLDIRVESRTGDTTQSVRTRQRERLPDVLVTTPESLTLLLTSPDAFERFGGLRGVIVDEFHEFIATKRGTQTELALARLRRIAPPLRAWALSATLPNAEEAARTVAGMRCSRVRVVNAPMDRRVVVDSVLPAEEGTLAWAGHLGLSMLGDVLDAIDPNVPTIVFTNTRSQAERWFHAIAWSRPEWTGFMALHHGSINREERERVEGGLKTGTLRLVVATSSLDLGVDFSPVERVFQIGSPKGVARLLQRAGRGSHRPLTGCRVTCVPTHAMELVEIAAARRGVETGEVEARTALSKPLDVLAQHLVTIALGGGFREEEAFDEVRDAWSYRALTTQELRWTLELVRRGGSALGAYPDFRRVEVKDGVYTVPSARISRLHRMNIGTITGDSTIEIKTTRGRSLGRIEENFVAHLEAGERFVFAGRVLEFVAIRDLVAFARPAKGTTRVTPIWSGTRLPISESLSDAIRRTLERARGGRLDCSELRAAAGMLGVQARESAIPSHDEVLVEIVRTREGTHLCMFPFEGRLVHAGLAAILALRISRLRPATLSIAVNDYGLELLTPDEAFDFPGLLTPNLFSRERLVDDAIESVNISELAKLQFREVARVAGLVWQSHPGSRKSGRQLQAGAGLLFDVLSEFDPENLLLHQARREVLERHFEAGRLATTLRRIEGAKLLITTPAGPTPMSFPLMIERQAGRLSSETIQDRVRRMTEHWRGNAS